MSVVPQGAWDKFKNIIRAAHDSFNQDELVWVRYTDTVPQFKEELGEGGVPISLKVLIGYNAFRTWPITKNDNSGQVDQQNMVVYLNRRYLGENLWLTPKGYFDFRPDQDYFIHRGIKYKADGDTLMSQAYDDPVLIQLVMRREEIKNGDKMFQQSEVHTAIVSPDPVGLVIRTLEAQLV